MYSSRISRWLMLTGVIALFIGCGEDLNVNQIFVSKAQKNALASLIEDAQIAYDNGDFKDALKFAEKAEKISPHNEQVAILLGYINLSLSGMDTFKIAKGLIATQSEKKDKGEDEKEGKSSGDDKSKNKGQNLLATSNNAVRFFETLIRIIGIAPETIEQLGKLSHDDDLKAFAAHDVVLPVTATKARSLESVNVLQRLNRAIEKVCPFVDEELRTPDVDARHDCQTSDTVRERETVSHFLWGFAHIAEAIVFYAVVQYTEAGRNKPNIALRAEALQNEAASLSLGAYADHVMSLSETMTKVYAVDDPDSQFSALINNLTLASDTFAHIGQMPKKMKRAITRAMTSINQKKDQVRGDNEIQQQANSFKNQLNAALARNLEQQINDYSENDPQDFKLEQKELCDAYATISGGITLPAACEQNDEN